jgi:hypothetical protein
MTVAAHAKPALTGYQDVAKAIRLAEELVRDVARTKQAEE